MKREFMIDIESLDTNSSAVVLSVGAVIWQTKYLHEENALQWEKISALNLILEMDEQLRVGRSVSQGTLIWWMQQDRTAQAEAFDPDRLPVNFALSNLNTWITNHSTQISPPITHFWASPATFDFPILETLYADFEMPLPWRYNQKYDVRTVVNEANYSVRDHMASACLSGIPHTPVYDCLWQIDLLTHARQKLSRRIGA